MKYFGWVNKYPQSEGGLLGVDTVRDEQSGLVRPSQENVNGFGTMSNGGYRDGGTQAPPSFNSSGGADSYIALEDLSDLQGDDLSNRVGGRIRIRLSECIESDGPQVRDSDDGQ